MSSAVTPKLFIPAVDKPTPRNEQVKKYVIGAVCVCSVILIGGVSALSSGKLPHIPKIVVLAGTFVFGAGGFIGCYIAMKKLKTVNDHYVKGEERGYTALSYAVEKGKIHVIKRELWFGANPFAPSKEGSALDIALSKEEPQRKRILNLFRGYNYDVDRHSTH